MTCERLASGGGKVASCLLASLIQYEFSLIATYPNNSAAATQFTSGMISMNNELLVPKYVGTALTTFEIQLKGSMVNNGTTLSSFSMLNVTYSQVPNWVCETLLILYAQGSLIAVVGAPSVHGNGKVLDLDAAASQDEDRRTPEPEAFYYSWTCTTSSKQPCVDMAGDSFDSKYFSSNTLSRVCA